MPTKKELPLSPGEIPEFCKSWIPHKGPLKYEPFFEDWRWNLLTIAAFLASGPANIAHTIKYGLKDEFFQRSLWKSEGYVPKLAMHSYGHEDVLNLLRGYKPKQNPNNPETPSRKVCVMVLGGGQAGNISLGVLKGMQEVGAYDRADGFLMISAGIPDVIYTEAGQNEEGVKVYQDDNTQEGHFMLLPQKKSSAIARLARFIKEGPKHALVNTATVGTAMRETRQVNLDAIRSSKREMLAQVTDAQTAQTHYIDIRKAADPIKVMEAGICLPGMSTVSSVHLEEGIDAVDGAFSNPIPLEEAFRRGYTDILVLSNNLLIPKNDFVHNTLQPFILKVLAKNRAYSYPDEIAKSLRRYNQAKTAAVEHLEVVIREDRKDRRVAVIEPVAPYHSGMLEKDRDYLVRAYLDAREFGRTEFADTSYRANTKRRVPNYYVALKERQNA